MSFAWPVALGVLILAVISAAFGAYGVLSSDNLTQILLASNTGTFLVYGMTNMIVLVAFAGRQDTHWLKHTLAWRDRDGAITLGERPVILTPLSNEVPGFPPKERVY